jgi:hypothetical protein
MLNMYWKVLVYTLLVLNIASIFYWIINYIGFLYVLSSFLYTVTYIKMLELDKELEKLKSKKLIEKENN